MRSPAVCYADFAAKREAYPREVIPGIFGSAADAMLNSHSLTEWLSDNALFMYPRGLDQLRALHEAARSGKYRKAAQPCDTLQPVEVTLEQGAPCSGWACVVGAALTALGYAWRLVTAGDELDPYRHVYVQAFYGGKWYTLDGKGSERGQAFNVDRAPEVYPVVNYWRAA